MRDAGGLALVDRVGRLDVRQRLVHEPLTCGVHDDRAGEVALREAEPRAVRERDRGTPPGVVHQVDGGADGDAGLDARAGVAGGRGAPGGFGGGGQVLLPQGVVLLEAAGPEDDAPAGADDDLGAVTLGADADHPAALDDQPGQRGLVVDRDVGIHQGLAQADRQRVAHRVHPPAAELADHPVEQHPEHGQRALEGAQRAEADLAEVGLGDDQVRRRLGVRRVQPLQLGAEDPAVHRHRLHGASTRPATRLLGQVVGVLGNPLELHRRLLEDEVDDLRAAVEEGVASLLRHHVTDDGLEVAPGLLGVVRVDLAGVAECPVAGDPHAAAGPSRRAAEVGALLDHDGVQAVLRGGECRGHPGPAGAHDDDVTRLFHRSSAKCAGADYRKTVTGSTMLTCSPTRYARASPRRWPPPRRPCTGPAAPRHLARPRRRRRLHDPAAEHRRPAQGGRDRARPQGRPLLEGDAGDDGRRRAGLRPPALRHGGLLRRPGQRGPLLHATGGGRGRVRPRPDAPRRGLHRGRRHRRHRVRHRGHRADRLPHRQLEHQDRRHHRRQRVQRGLRARRDEGRPGQRRPHHDRGQAAP